MDKDSPTIGDVLTKQVEDILPSRKGLERLMRRKSIRVYLGVDPTASELHLGHMVPLRKLKQFQQLGHHAILVFGTFTAQIGDPSGRDIQRKPLTGAQIKKNMASYRQQVAKILDLSKTEILHNGDWLEKLRFSDFVKLASYFTVPQLLERDMFQNRMKKGGEVWLNEFLYPLMQGYDSVAADVDLEIGATDQTFNMLVGRKLQKIYKKKEKFVLTTPMLPGLDGRKMSKTYGNTVNIKDSPQEMYGKLMSLRDEYIVPYVEMCTETPATKAKELQEALKTGRLSPRDEKAQLAGEIVSLYHGAEAASRAAQEFGQIFREKKRPSHIPVFTSKRKALPLRDVVFEAGLASSKSDAQRLIEQGGVRIDENRQTNPNFLLQLKKGMVIQVGKRRFVKIG